MKLPASLRHDNDRLTARNLAYAGERVSLIFAGSNGDNLTLPSRLLCSERNKCPIRARSFITSTLAIPSPFQMLFNSKACYFFVNKLCFPKNPAGYPIG